MIARLVFVLIVLSILALVAARVFSGKGGADRALLFIRGTSKVAIAVAFALFVLYLVSQLDNIL